MSSELPTVERPTAADGNDLDTEPAPSYIGRPSFKEWWKIEWLNFLTLLCLGGLSVGLSRVPVAFHRPFLLWNTDGSLLSPEFARPDHAYILNSLNCAIVSAAIPIAIYLLMFLRIGCFWDLNNAIMGHTTALLLSQVSHLLAKCLVGGYRPNFLQACKPDLERDEGIGYAGVYHMPDICTGDPRQIFRESKSWFSGHTAAATGAFLFLFLYLNAKLKFWADHHASLWKLCTSYISLLVIMLISGWVTVDAAHNWYDSLMGVFVGSLLALFAYRAHYQSILDWRTNHIPLMPDGRQQIPVSRGPVFTRQAGWGKRE
ncbi:hypothetical protein BDY21DRAFT_6711 [Lineolata rhizophorae]|uniref:Phosphatidic acid phosphatase type 2/haloperoxidase domain-containing protein n=1 Tax=Lineolata rhizophorae TaxID=578093 RepID=A0A6A6PDM6_9PEZI|nr:hypothetical protein BDY21DRAFT_6711 [Lineolata rhizophorae]